MRFILTTGRSEGDRHAKVGQNLACPLLHDFAAFLPQKVQRLLPSVFSGLGFRARNVTSALAYSDPNICHYNQTPCIYPSLNRL
jgi:hypothetical protein